MAKISTLELDPERPLWYIFVKEDYDENTSILFIMVHHLLSDGMGIMSLFAMMNDKLSKEMISHHRQIPFFHYYILPLLYLPIGIFWYTYIGLKSKSDPKMYPFHLNTGRQSGEKIYLESKRYKLDDLRKCYNKFGKMKLNDYMFASISAGLSTYFNKLGVKDQSYFSVTIPANMKPLPNSLEEVKFCNTSTIWMANVPLSTDLDYVMKETRKYLDIGFSLPLLRTGMYVINFFGSCPAAIARMLMYGNTSRLNTVISNTPGPPKPMYFCDQKVKDIGGTGPNVGHSGLTILISSYCGLVKLQILADKNLKMDPKVLMKHIEDQLDSYIVKYC